MRLSLFAASFALIASTQLSAQAPTAAGPTQAIGLSQGTAAIHLRAQNGRPRTAAEYYGLANAAQGPVAAPVTSGSFQASRPTGVAGNKPFSHVTDSPTLSPYLNLYREQSDEAIPNYYAFVRPQQQQNELNRKQALQLQKLSRQVRQVQYTSPVSDGVGGRFNNTGRFYQSWNR